MSIIQFKGETTRFREDHTSEQPIRSIIKSISWRIIGTIDTICISWWITGTLGMAFSIGGIELITKMALYFFMSGYGTQ